MSNLKKSVVGIAADLLSLVIGICLFFKSNNLKFSLSN